MKAVWYSFSIVLGIFAGFAALTLVMSVIFHFLGGVATVLFLSFLVVWVVTYSMIYDENL